MYTALLGSALGSIAIAMSIVGFCVGGTLAVAMGAYVALVGFGLTIPAL